MTDKFTKVALVIKGEIFSQNRLFDLSIDLVNSESRIVFAKIKDYLATQNILLQTVDMYWKNGEEPDVYIFTAIDKADLPLIMNIIIKRGRIILWPHEPPIISRLTWCLIRFLPFIFAGILSWSDYGKSNKRFVRTMIPEPRLFEPNSDGSDFYSRKYFAMIVSSKSSKYKGERYSLRNAIINWFEKNECESFDLYGTGWDRTLKCYKGECGYKPALLENYKYYFAVENSRVKGYITEKMFDAIIAGCVPIYCGAPDVKKYIPQNCFIDFSEFSSVEKLVEHVCNNISQEDWYKMRQACLNFASKLDNSPFSISGFCTTLARTIKSVSL